MKKHITYSAAAAAMLLAIAGCVSMTPTYTDPYLGFTAPDVYQQVALTEKKPEPVTIADRWWEEFDDPQLNQLIDEVLKNNWDIMSIVY